MGPSRSAMREPTSTYATRRHAIRVWLLAVAAMIFAMVLVGGATRLTESGLSITEWQPVTGAIPPLSQAAWQAEFEKYKTIPQYQQMNRGMSLAEFKTIFWWEWTHRLLGRLIGVVFLLPFLWFLLRGWIDPGLRGRLGAIFGLGALQGAVGWWMVASGLAGRTEVSQYRLAFHLTLACVIYVAILWTAERLAARTAPAVAPRLRYGAVALMVLVLFQIYLGALTAGLRAGLTYNTWPLIDGAFVPSGAHLFFDQPLWRNFFENALTVQFEHRMMAYTVLVVALLHAVDALRMKRRGAATTGAVVLALAVILQATLGVLTLLHQVPIGLGLAHQGMALAVLTIATVHAARVTAGIRLQPDPAPDRR
jgi:cytochrome c oxidase assembly protein subunit 15